MLLTRYARWLHTGWPAGTVEKLPVVHPDGTTRIAGLRVVGDLGGVPLLKVAADTGARAIQAIVAERSFARGTADHDVIIVGGGVSGISAALEARKLGLSFVVLESARPFATIHDFPKGKPIFTYPADMKPAGSLSLTAGVKEALVAELEAQRTQAGISTTQVSVDRIVRNGDVFEVHAGKEVFRASRVIVAIGRSGNFRELGCEGEALDKVTHRLHDPADHAHENVLVVGGGDSALEAAIALSRAGAKVTLAYRGAAFSRAKPENVDALKGSRVTVLFGATPTRMADGSVTLKTPTGEQRLDNDRVFAMVGREAPLEFFRRSGVPIAGEWSLPSVAGFAAFLAACFFVYNWKAGTELNAWFSAHELFPFDLPDHIGASAFGHVLGVTLRQPGFYYSLLYSVVIVVFGCKRIVKRRTPYITAQTVSLMVVQVVPLFLLPYFVLPTLGAHGAFDHGVGKTVADALFPVCSYDYGREYWRAFGIILAWPLFFWNVMNSQPLTAWLVVSCVQTFVVIPIIVWRWGKGAYCGWICSCGALAETLGDGQRQKMPHGKAYNRLNLVGQVILLWATLLSIARVASWTSHGTIGKLGARFVDATFYAHAWYDYYHLVDIFLAGVVGVGCYFWLSGRVWCRFACPLAALMHVYARLGQFRIFADKKKCISCNVCTSVCHQGIDVMSFANKGEPMADPECVRCSACVQSCPTGVLSFGRLTSSGPVLDTLGASPVQLREGRRLPVVS